MISFNFYMKTQISWLPLKKVPEHYNEVITIIEKELGYSPENRFADDFLYLIEPDNWDNCYVLFHGKEVIGHIGIKPTTFFLNDVEIKIALIGGIAIKENHQGKGFFKEIFPKILAERNDEFAMYLLWTGEAEGYKKFGFYEIGKIIQTGEYDFDNALRYFAKKLNELTEDEKNYIKISYQQSFTEYFKPFRTTRDWESFFKIPSVDVFFKKRGNKILSYFMINKGQDLTQIIHEIGSDNKQELSQLCHDLSKFKLWLPENFCHENSQSIFLFLGVFKLANYNMLLNVAKKLNINLPEQSSVNEKEILEAFIESKSVNFYIPGINSI